MDWICGKLKVLKANQIIIEKGTSKWMTAGMCVGISVVLHIVVAIMICLRVIMLNTEVVVIDDDIEEQEEMVIAIKLDQIQPTPPSIVAPPKDAPLTPDELKDLASQESPALKPELTPELDIKPKDIPQYTRTSDVQLTGEVPDTNLQGERDTIAASNANTVAGAPNRPSVRGEEPKDGQEEMVDTTFQDGILEHMNRGGEAPKPRTQPPADQVTDPENIAEIDQEELKSSVEPTKDVGEALDKAKLATTNKEAKEFLETEKKIALNEDLPTSQNTGAKENKGVEEQEKTIANKQPDPDAIKQKPQDKQQKEQESQPNTAENKSASSSNEKGFRSEAKATVMEGTISRRSKIGSKNVKSTPVGKYMAQISKLVEQEWQRRCMMHADLIQPGTLRIGFMVDEQGKVKNINTIAQTLGSENQRSLTFQALTTVKIPPMPKKVKESQGGDPLEFRYYFRFQ